MCLRSVGVAVEPVGELDTGYRRYLIPEGVASSEVIDIGRTTVSFGSTEVPGTAQGWYTAVSFASTEVLGTVQDWHTTASFELIEVPGTVQDWRMRRLMRAEEVEAAGSRRTAQLRWGSLLQ